MPKPTKASRLMEAFRKAGWTPNQIEALCTSEAHAQLGALRELMFPSPALAGGAPAILDEEVGEIFTEAALEEIEEGLGTIHLRLTRQLILAGVVHIRDLVVKTEQEASRILGVRSSKTYRAAEMLLAKHGLHFGMTF